jgi:thiosulfate/3-mercaptopyruvate sulfurtransferase
MPYTTIISAADLRPHIEEPHWVVVDCRFALNDPEYGRRAYQEAHIPGAVYADLNEDMSGPIIPGETGRHPLPDPHTFAQTVSELGIDKSVQVVAYDDMGGVLAASRLWWMLRWIGHEHVAVLDGGFQAWQQEGYPTSSGTETRPPRAFEIHQMRDHLLMSTEEVQARLDDPNFRLFDVRKPERYRGEVEPLDPVAGHIPGAISAPFDDNLGPSGRFRSTEELRVHYRKLLNGAQAGQAAFYCGSGASSAHSALALMHIGLGEPRLYAGSWSEWILDPERPVERGEGQVAG